MKTGQIEEVVREIQKPNLDDTDRVKQAREIPSFIGFDRPIFDSFKTRLDELDQQTLDAITNNEGIYEEATDKILQELNKGDMDIHTLSEELARFMVTSITYQGQLIGHIQYRMKDLNIAEINTAIEAYLNQETNCGSLS